MTKTQQTNGKKTSASIVWFEIPADDPDRAKKFYSSLFGWKIEKFGGADDYLHIDTEGADETPDGGLMRRKYPKQSITNYVAVSSVDESRAKVEQMGGKICKAKTAIPQMATSLYVRTRRAMSSRFGNQTTVPNNRI